MSLSKLKLVADFEVPIRRGNGVCGDAAQEPTCWESMSWTANAFPQGEGMSPAMASLAWATELSNSVVPAARQGCGFPVLSGQLCAMRWKPLAQHASPESSKNSVLSSEMCSPFAYVLFTALTLTSTTCCIVWWGWNSLLGGDRVLFYCMLVQHDRGISGLWSSQALAVPQRSWPRCSLLICSSVCGNIGEVTRHPPEWPVTKETSSFFTAVVFDVHTRKGFFQLYLILFYSEDQCKAESTIYLSPSFPLQSTL